MKLFNFPKSTPELLEYLRSIPNTNSQHLLDAYTQCLPLLKDDTSSLFIFLDFINLSKNSLENEEIEHFFNIFKAKLRRFKPFWTNFIKFMVLERKKDYNLAFSMVFDYLKVKNFEGKEMLVEELTKERQNADSQANLYNEGKTSMHLLNNKGITSMHLLNNEGITVINSLNNEGKTGIHLLNEEGHQNTYLEEDESNEKRHLIEKSPKEKVIIKERNLQENVLIKEKNLIDISLQENVLINEMNLIEKNLQEKILIDEKNLIQRNLQSNEFIKEKNLIDISLQENVLIKEKNLIQRNLQENVLIDERNPAYKILQKETLIDEKILHFREGLKNDENPISTQKNNENIRLIDFSNKFNGNLDSNTLNENNNQIRTSSFKLNRQLVTESTQIENYNNRRFKPNINDYIKNHSNVNNKNNDDSVNKLSKSFLEDSKLNSKDLITFKEYSSSLINPFQEVKILPDSNDLKPEKQQNKLLDNRQKEEKNPPAFEIDINQNNKLRFSPNARSPRIGKKIVEENAFSCDVLDRTINLTRTIKFKGKELICLTRIGKGGYSNVYKVLDNGKIYALKETRIDDQENLSCCVEEINLLKRLSNCDYVIKMIDHSISKENVNILLEYGEIDLQKLIQTGPLDIFYIKYVWKSILKIIEFIHQNRIVHRDIKPANFVLVKGRLKIIDFGISKSIRGDTTSIINFEKAGTLNYISPEQCCGGKVGRSSDIWAAGCILYHMIYRRTIHNGRNVMEVLRVMSEEFEIKYDAANAGAIETMKACLRHNPKMRGKPEELLKMKFLEID